MQRRQITLEDGRYLVFYTFDAEAASPSGAGAVNVEASANEREEPVAVEPQATEERGV